MASDSQDEEWQLLYESDSEDSYTRSIQEHDLITAPLMTREALIRSNQSMRTQYGLLGKVLAIHSKGHTEVPKDQRLYLSSNAPFSALVCGVQGSGKSHTVGTILENMLIPNFPPIGSVTKALSGLVLHFGEGGSGTHPNEAAWLCQSITSLVSGPAVRVYVSRSSLATMRAVYAPLGNKVTVEPLYFQKSELDAAAFLSMMAVGSSESAPLYMQVVLSILRELGERYSYQAFLKKLELSKQKFNPAQLSGLEQHMSLLTSFLDPSSMGPPTSRFASGQLTIIDLSDPFLDAASACGLFEIILRLFVRADVGTGKVVVMDEAHKYLSSSKSSSGLTNALLRLVRQQRHLAMRVIISTQEPTVVPPVLLDLCTVAILHRFSSPSWWQHLIQHVSADFSQSDAFDKLVNLQTGQAIVLAPSAIGVFEESGDVESSRPRPSYESLSYFGRRYIIMKTRRRVTEDGGASVLVLDS
ncbi:hypothetical protein K443DRAFT_672389 [Laccaria amethystina LaAM-08-1]|uniref:Zona occludens toxin N-terminal domain-containing protein n=1 Tax=Laccaria amethystina LaAM-08-1 TaxID=1095629 RepID=A0A0C9YDD5_9AGAR|nr:hypothetical protein K443DRAFT_672389 [Laccaria amethystina LaAM-08-1]